MKTILSHANLVDCVEPKVRPDIAVLIEDGRIRAILPSGEADRVLTELAKLGFANMADYIVAVPGGDPYLDFSILTRDQAAALQEVTVENYVEGRGENAREVKRVKFKLADKRAALVDIGRHLGMFKDRLELSGNVNHADNDQIAADIAQIFGLARPERPADEAEGSGLVISGKAQRG